MVVGIPLTPMDGRDMSLSSSPRRPNMTSTDPLGVDADACTNADFEGDDAVGRVPNESELWWTGAATMMVLPSCLTLRAINERSNQLREFVTFIEKGSS